MDSANPFALVRASDYTDEQINSLWVDIGASTISNIIEPLSRTSKFILGGKGTGKTHLLRYHSYSVARLRAPKTPGVEILLRQKFMGIFLRATGVDANRFEGGAQSERQWQQLFGVYIELRLTEGLLEALCDIKQSSPSEEFQDGRLIETLSSSITDQSVRNCQDISELRDWVLAQRRQIEDAINNAAFVGTLNLRLPFAIGTFCLPMSRAIAAWNRRLGDVPVIFLVDEIENFSRSQQQVINSLIRYGEGRATFRVSGRLYAMKTNTTIADGEENREGTEFKTIFLDDILRNNSKYPDFARSFFAKRLNSVGLDMQSRRAQQIDPHERFEEVLSSDLYTRAFDALKIDPAGSAFVKQFTDLMASNCKSLAAAEIILIVELLTANFPPILQKLNLLLFCKKHKQERSFIATAKKLNEDANDFCESNGRRKNYYATACSHYAGDLFAQICRESKKVIGVPYAGFETFVKMSSGNPRNLLIILGKAYSIAAFKGVDFINGSKLSIAIQTEAVLEAARFAFDSDSNFGSQSEQARTAVTRLASILRTARYALNIPEVSPLAVSFSHEDLTVDSRNTLKSALNYSFLFEIAEGRPDRNSQRVNKKYQLNPALSPRWGLPVGRRGDLGLGRDLVNAIFDIKQQDAFDTHLKSLEIRWNNPFRNVSEAAGQVSLF